eukprot:1160404-Pelagomonas_calceolata.AAC.7
MAVQCVVADVGGAALEPLHADGALGHVKVVMVMVFIPLQARARRAGLEGECCVQTPTLESSDWTHHSGRVERLQHWRHNAGFAWPLLACTLVLATVGVHAGFAPTRFRAFPAARHLADKCKAQYENVSSAKPRIASHEVNDLTDANSTSDGGETCLRDVQATDHANPVEAVPPHLFVPVELLRNIGPEASRVCQAVRI